MQFVCIQMCHTAQFRLLTKLYSNYAHEYITVAINLHEPTAWENISKAKRKVIIKKLPLQSCCLCLFAITNTVEENIAVWFMKETLELFTSCKARLAGWSLNDDVRLKGHCTASFIPELLLCPSFLQDDFKMLHTFKTITVSVSEQGQVGVVSKQEVCHVPWEKKDDKKKKKTPNKIWIPLGKKRAELSCWIVSWIFQQGFASSSCCRSVSFCVWWLNSWHWTDVSWIYQFSKLSFEHLLQSSLVCFVDVGFTSSLLGIKETTQWLQTSDLIKTKHTVEVTIKHCYDTKWGNIKCSISFMSYVSTNLFCLLQPTTKKYAVFFYPT